MASTTFEQWARGRYEYDVWTDTYRTPWGSLTQARLREQVRDVPAYTIGSEGECRSIFHADGRVSIPSSDNPVLLLLGGAP